MGLWLRRLTLRCLNAARLNGFAVSGFECLRRLMGFARLNAFGVLMADAVSGFGWAKARFYVSGCLIWFEMVHL